MPSVPRTSGLLQELQPNSRRGLGGMETEDHRETVEPKIEFVDDYRVRFLYDWSHRGYIIPQGFVTDGASVPRILWNLMPPLGPLRYAAFFHDFGYQHGYLLIEPMLDTEMSDEDYDFYKNWKTLFTNWVPKHCKEPRSFFDDFFYKEAKKRNWRQGALALIGLKLGGWVAWNRYRRRGPAAYNSNSLHLPGR